MRHPAQARRRRLHTRVGVLSVCVLLGACSQEDSQVFEAPRIALFQRDIDHPAENTLSLSGQVVDGVLHLSIGCQCAFPGPPKDLRIGLRMPASALEPTRIEPGPWWPDFGEAAGPARARFLALPNRGEWLIEVDATTTWTEDASGSTCQECPTWFGGPIPLGLVDLRVKASGSHRVELFAVVDGGPVEFCASCATVEPLAMPLSGGVAHIP
jgi:hypothetical protein